MNSLDHPVLRWAASGFLITVCEATWYDFCPQKIHVDPQRSGDPTSADGFLWPSAPSPVVALYKIERGGHVVRQPVVRYPRILGRTTTAVDMPELDNVKSHTFRNGDLQLM